MSEFSNETVYLVKYTLDTVSKDSGVHGIRELAKSVSDKILDTGADKEWSTDFIKEVRFVLKLVQEDTVVSSKMTFLIDKSLKSLGKEKQKDAEESLADAIERITKERKVEYRPLRTRYVPYFYDGYYYLWGDKIMCMTTNDQT